jgi:hypothetical protein|nr:MAG TPA: hypothetical protein [Caudoviricetes sp.]
MNSNLIDIIKVLISKGFAYKSICIDLGINHLCTGCECNECLLNTSPLFISDYPNLLIQIKDITYEQSVNGNT